MEIATVAAVVNIMVAVYNVGKDVLGGCTRTNDAATATAVEIRGPEPSSLRSAGSTSVGLPEGNDTRSTKSLSRARSSISSSRSGASHGSINSLGSQKTLTFSSASSAVSSWISTRHASINSLGSQKTSISSRIKPSTGSTFSRSRISSRHASINSGGSHWVVPTPATSSSTWSSNPAAGYTRSHRGL